MKNENKKMKLGTLMILGCATVFAIITLILQPIYVVTVSDITVSKTVLPRIVNIILDLTETLAFAFCYSVIIFAAVTKSKKSGFVVFGIYFAASLVRRACVLLITHLTYHGLTPTDWFSVCAALAFECVLALIITFVAVVVGERYRARRAEIQKAARIAGDSSYNNGLEFTAVFSKQNPLQLCMLVAGIALSVVKIGMRISSDIKYNSFYGAPTETGEILIMAAYYLSDILVCAVFYALSWLMMTKLEKQYLREKSL